MPEPQTKVTHQQTIFTKSFNLTTMKKFISAALVVAMMAASCTNKEELGNNNAPAQPAGDGSVTFAADFAEPIAKATPSYDENGHAVAVLWDLDDQVGVYPADGAPAQFVAQAAGATTTLKGMVAVADKYYAMYPYDENATIAAGQITTALPAAQVAAKDAFTAHLAVASTTGSSFSFSNVCGLVRVYVGCEHVTKIEFKGNSDEVVAGDIVVDAATAAYTLGTTQEKVITVTPPADAAAFETGAYYFSVLPQNFAAGFTVTYYTANGNVDSRSTGAVDVPRSRLVVGKALTDIAGTGTEADPFVVANVHDFCCLSEVLSTEKANYVELSDNIDMAGVTTWTPINNNRVVSEVAEIYFDGKNHSILNFGPTTITKNSAGSTNVGIFGVFSGKCKNLNVVVKESGLDLASLSTLGVVCGYAGYNDGTTKLYAEFENVHVSGGPVTGTKVVGGFAASSVNVKFVDCSAQVDVTSKEKHVGGFIGRYDDAPVKNEFVRCFATGDVACTTSGERFIGGFIGGNTGGKGVTFSFDSCYASGNVSGDYQVSPFVGFIEYGTITMTNCYATGNASSCASPTSAKQIGGLLGGTKGAATMTNCYYNGKFIYKEKASAKDSKGRNESFGGLFGLNAEGSSNISNSFAAIEYDLYNSTSVSSWASKYIGGIVGYNKGTLTVSNCYAQGAVIDATAKITQVGGIVGQSDNTATLSGNKFYGATASVGGAADGKVSDTGSEAVATPYSNASAVATALGWSAETWNLTGATPTLKCFE